MGTRQSKIDANGNKQPREFAWHLRFGYEVRDPVVERDAPRISKNWPKPTEILPKRSYYDPRAQDDPKVND